MSYKLLTIPPFEKQAKRLLKKYPFLKIELAELIGILKTNPLMGIPLGGDCFKIRLAIASKKKGIWRCENHYLFRNFRKLNLSFIDLR